MSEFYIDKTEESTPPLSTPTDAEESDECVEEYVFYVYNRASFGQDTDLCPACEDLYGEIDNDVLDTMHDDYDELEHEAACNLKCYDRRKYFVYLKPSNYDRLTSETLDMNIVLFALANMCDCGDLDIDELGLDELTEGELVEDAHDDLYVCYGHDGVEIEAWPYFREHKIHLCFDGSGCSSHAEWHDDKVHPVN